MLFILAITTGIVVSILVLMPFFVGEGGRLETASSEHSPAKLKAMKKALLKRYLEDEEAALKAVISARVWENRKAYLVNRYIDTARRLDFITYVGSMGGRGVRHD